MNKKEKHQAMLDDDADLTTITDIDGVVKIISTWHQNMMSQLVHYKALPTGTELQVEDEEPVKLEGDFQKGYLLAMDLALSVAANLPNEMSSSEPNEHTAH